MDQPTLRILIVDDELPIRRLLRATLGNHFTVFEAENGVNALMAVITHRPDIVLLDLGLPDVDGIEITHRLREWSEVPIIILSIRNSEQDKVAALDAGADDYLTKPFSAGELTARIRAALRHCAKSKGEPIYQNRDLSIDLVKRQVSLRGQPVQLTPTEYDILRVLVQHAGKVLTHRQLIQRIWMDNDVEKNHLLRVNVSNLRHKIETDPTRPRHIITEPGVGYRLRESER